MSRIAPPNIISAPAVIPLDLGSGRARVSTAPSDHATPPPRMATQGRIATCWALCSNSKRTPTKPNRDRDQKAPAEALLAKYEDLQPDGDERQGCLEHGGEAGRHVLLCPEHGAIRDHEHQRADHYQAAPLFARRARAPAKTHHGVEQGAGQKEARRRRQTAEAPVAPRYESPGRSIPKEHKWPQTRAAPGRRSRFSASPD